MLNKSKKPLTTLDEPFLDDILDIKNEYKRNKNKNHNFINEAQLKIIDDLVFMGFDLEMIDMCFCFFSINTLEKAIELMTKENDIWQHNYIKSERNDCIICNEISSHIDFIVDREEKLEKMKKLNDSKDEICKKSIENLRESLGSRILNEENNMNFNNSIIISEESKTFTYKKNRRSSRSSNFYSKNDIEIEEENKHFMENDSIHDTIIIGEDFNNEEESLQELKDCEVCFDNIDLKDTIKLTCGHIFCGNCWIDYIKDKIDNNQIKEILCMDYRCKLKLDEEKIKKIINSDSCELEKKIYSSKYEKFKNENDLLANKYNKLCPIPDCGGFANTKKKKKNILTCNNNHKFCIKCNNPEHPKIDCDKLQDEYFKKWRSGKTVKKCPSCKFWTEKNAGCNHMTCRGCNSQWCWICGNKCSYGHYNFGFCARLQFIDNKNIHSRFWRYKNYLKKGLLKHLFYILIHFVLFLTISSYWISFRKLANMDAYFSKFNKAIYITFFLTAFFTSMMFQPLMALFAPIYLGLSIFLIIFMPFAACSLTHFFNDQFFN